MIANFAGDIDTGNASFAGVNDAGKACRTFDSMPVTLKEQSVKI